MCGSARAGRATPRQPPNVEPNQTKPAEPTWRTHIWIDTHRSPLLFSPPFLSISLSISAPLSLQYLPPSCFREELLSLDQSSNVASAIVYSPQASPFGVVRCTYIAKPKSTPGSRTHILSWSRGVGSNDISPTHETPLYFIYFVRTASASKLRSLFLGLRSHANQAV